MNTSYKGIIYASIAALLWAILVIFLKIAVYEIPPITIVWFRFLIAFLILLLYTLIKNPGQKNFISKAGIKIIFPAIFLTFNYLGFMMGIEHTTPNNAQIFIQTGPVLFAVFGFILFKEKFQARHLIGFLMVIAGFIFFYSGQSTVYISSIYNKGVFLVIFGGVMWTGYAIFQKNLVTKYTTTQLNLLNFGLPILIILPFVNFEILSDLSLKYYLILIFLGLNTLGAYTCLSLALKYTEANKVSIISICNPIITFIIMAIFGYYEVTFIESEHFNSITLFGAFFVISGAIIVIIKKNKKINL